MAEPWVKEYGPDDAAIAAREGHRFGVTLPQAGRHRWILTDMFDKHVVQVQGNPSNPHPPDGGTGKRWLLQAMREGSTTLEFVTEKPTSFEPNPAPAPVTIDVSVRGW